MHGISISLGHTIINNISKVEISVFIMFRVIYIFENVQTNFILDLISYVLPNWDSLFSELPFLPYI